MFASYANDDFEMKKLYYEHRKKKACAFMQSRTDPHIEVQSEGTVVDLILPLEPKDQAFALFSAKKPIVGLSRKKHSLPATISPCTPIDEKPLWLRNCKIQRSCYL